MIPNAAPAFNFDLGETAEQIRDVVQSYASDNIAPIAAEIDRTDEFPRHLWREMGELGLLGITVEEEFGGAGLGYLEHCVVMEEISPGLRICWPILWRAFQPLCQPDPPERE